MADFKIALAITANLEGGYSNHPNDRGGETWKGIARKKHPNWNGWPVVDQLRSSSSFPKNLDNNAQLKGFVAAFYKKQFWDALRLDDIVDAKIAGKLFDMAVNIGVSTAAKFLQKALNLLNDRQRLYKDLAIDGQVGPVTVGAVNNHPRPDNLYKALNVLQGGHYLEIGEHAESQEAFMNGWFSNRIASLFTRRDSNNLA